MKGVGLVKFGKTMVRGKKERDRAGSSAALYETASSVRFQSQSHLGSS